MSTAQAPDVLLHASGIVKRYPGNLALDRVSYRVYRNAVNVLIGENGAGKSTLMRVLAGVEQPDEGTMRLNDARIALPNPAAASAHGIAIVHQELSVMPNLDISENVYAGREPVHAGVAVDRPAEQRGSRQALLRLCKDLPVTAGVAQLSLGDRQMVELARAVTFKTQLLILDEPTSALSTVETDALFRVMEQLKAQGVTIIYISHRLHELMHLGDYFTVLRSGRVVGEGVRGEVTRQWIVERMSGRTAAQRRPAATRAVAGAEVLRVVDMTLRASAAGEAAQAPVHGVSFSLAAGEILGIYGLLGAGRTELVEALVGVREIAGGSVLVRGTPVRLRNPADAAHAGLVLVPEDRQRDGLVPELSIRENVMLAAADGKLLSRRAEAAAVRDIGQKLNLKAIDLELPVTSLSGGNQQKVLLARCLLRKPRVLILDEPTRGVDVGAKAEIYSILRALAAEGLAVLFTSSEVEEVGLLADRTLVMRHGVLARELPRDEVNDEALFAAASPEVRTLNPRVYDPQTILSGAPA